MVAVADRTILVPEIPTSKERSEVDEPRSDVEVSV
jgi:hypothetical protein